jgi:hypothetical protein
VRRETSVLRNAVYECASPQRAVSESERDIHKQCGPGGWPGPHFICVMKNRRPRATRIWINLKTIEGCDLGVRFRIDLRFCFTYTPGMKQGWVTHFLQRNSTTKIISVNPSFSEAITSHSQLGRESIAFAFSSNFS